MTDLELLRSLQTRVEKLERKENGGSLASYLPLSCLGRLTLASGTPVPTTDQTGKTTIYLTPYLGDQISLYDTTLLAWRTLSFAELSVAVPATIYRLFDVFAYIDANGNVALETLDWNQTTGTIDSSTNATPIVVTDVGHPLVLNDVVAIAGHLTNTNANSLWQLSAVAGNTFTLHGSVGNGVGGATGSWYKMNGATRATALAFQDGRYVKSGDASRLYLGTGCTDATSGQISDTDLNRRLWNYHNRLFRRSQYSNSTSHTYSGVQRYWNNDHLNAKTSLVIGVLEDVWRLGGTSSIAAGVLGENNLTRMAVNDSTGTTIVIDGQFPFLNNNTGRVVGGAEVIYKGLTGFTVFPVVESGGATAGTFANILSQVGYFG